MDEFFDFDRAASAIELTHTDYCCSGELPVDDSATEFRAERNVESHEGTITGNAQLASSFRNGRHNLIEERLQDSKTSLDEIHPDPDQSIKAGAKFSRASVRVLKAWLSSHHRYPYPAEEDKEGLRQQTGLSSSQIMNWLANARRKGRAQTSKSISLVENNQNSPINIPRPATPAVQEMNPLDRWRNSPPETEPASVSAIAQAVRSSASLSHFESTSDLMYGSDSSWRAHSVNYESSVASLELSDSSRSSSSSVLSHGSGRSHGSFGSPGSRRSRRRCRQPARISSAIRPRSPPRTFQCTFCTESFKTKYDWQRHEKSLHLSLEHWVCGLNGATSLCKETNLISCVYCGLANPDSDHAEGHDHSACFERPKQERTFYRKDHLRQHLSLMHNSKFQSWSMNSWKVEMQAVKSRCGFCGLNMDTWKVRANHLADHFKSGQNIADWKGNWGFESQILDIVENGIPPYLIHTDRISLLPYKASNDIPKVQRTLYELVKMGLVDFINDQIANEQVTTDKDLLQEARRICNTIDNVAKGVRGIGASWFRDLLLENAQASAPLPVDDLYSSRRDNNFACVSCPKEVKLKDFVDSFRSRGDDPTTFELQTEACRIMTELEAISSFPCDAALKWFCFLVSFSGKWLESFRRRNKLDSSLNDLFSDTVRASSVTQELELPPVQISEEQRSILNHTINVSTKSTKEPTAMLNWDLSHLISPTAIHTSREMTNKPHNSSPFARKALPLYPQFRPITQSELSTSTSATANPPPWYFFSDSNCYQRLKHELSRFVASCLSPNNPAQHVPTDDEIRNQARWIIFDDDDPWNQTAADNAGWLLAFKRDVGLMDEGSEQISGPTVLY